MNLRDYVALIREIEQLDQRIAKLQSELDHMTPRTKPISDTVTKGKKGKKPLGVVKIEGDQDYREINRKRAELFSRIQLWETLKAEAQEEVAVIEGIISEIEDPDTRRMMGYYCLDGYANWDEVAMMMGEGWTAVACRVRYHRFLKTIGGDDAERSDDGDSGESTEQGADTDPDSERYADDL